jgi:hypothetical protein
VAVPQVAAAFYPESYALMEEPDQFGDFFLKNATGDFEIYDGPVTPR